MDCLAIGARRPAEGDAGDRLAQHLSLLNNPFGHRIALPMKTATDDIQSGALLRSSLPACVLAHLHSGDPIADRVDAQHCDGVAGSVTENSSGRATLVAMVQAADLREGDNGAGRGRLYGTRVGAILVEREMRAAVPSRGW